MHSTQPTTTLIDKRIWTILSNETVKAQQRINQGKKWIIKEHRKWFNSLTKVNSYIETEIMRNEKSGWCLGKFRVTGRSKFSTNVLKNQQRNTADGSCNHNFPHKVPRMQKLNIWEKQQKQKLANQLPSNSRRRS